MKTCSKCKQEKPVTDFNVSKRSKDGFQVYCKSCYTTYYKAYNASRKDAKAQDVSKSKVCRDCGLEKPISQFGTRSVSLDKKNIYCAPCWKARVYNSIRKMKQNRGK